MPRDIRVVKVRFDKTDETLEFDANEPGVQDKVLLALGSLYKERGVGRIHVLFFQRAMGGN